MPCLHAALSFEVSLKYFLSGGCLLQVLLSLHAELRLLLLLLSSRPNDHHRKQPLSHHGALPLELLMLSSQRSNETWKGLSSLHAVLRLVFLIL
jgi:hypothetical protein